MCSLHSSLRSPRSFRCITIETTVDPSNARSAKAILTVAKVLDWEAFDTLYVTVSVEDRKTNENYLDKKFSKGK